jgi:hypothetical protein
MRKRFRKEGSVRWLKEKYNLTYHQSRAAQAWASKNCVTKENFLELLRKLEGQLAIGPTKLTYLLKQEYLKLASTGNQLQPMLVENPPLNEESVSHLLENAINYN